MNILIFGVQGSGKSTIGEYIAGKLNVPFIATGDVFRKLREEKSPLGKLVKDKYDQGLLTPDEPTMEIVNEKLKEKDAQEGFVLDGAPRNLQQVDMFKKSPDLLVLVELDEKEAVARLFNRGRIDDTKEKIEKRIAWYKEQTIPVIEHYKDKNLRVIKVDNTPSENIVRKNIDDLLKEFKGN